MTTPAPLLLALDFGGTKLTAAMTRPGRGGWLAHRRFFTPATADGPYEYNKMLALAGELIAEVGRPAAIGVSFGGPVDAAAGLVRLSHHVPGWENVPLADRLRDTFGLPVAVDNDANVAALGEYRFGAGRGCQNLLYVTVSTGIGGGWILNGQPYRGADGMAGEIGHTIVQTGGLPCVCGRRGCLEAEACGPGIANRARLYLEQNAGQGDALLRLAQGDPQNITAKMVAEAASAGDPFSRRVLVESARRLGLGLGNAINLMNPDRVVLGGGVTKSGELWWQTVREAARANVLPEISVNIVPAAFTDDAPLWGAVALAEQVAG
ncbi:MAG: ROK family protein [Chloroflexi bacterium]|nr:MAG: ROK family protein [Chloroflexota bacterium]